ncbi:APC family permease [Ruicaihuangia caeni]|uniref:Amino acid permease n=1 Tax=Ruicaihuangia caeni TaxID=3042517 RepID=A0AAW6T4I6_9MICO|nr:amino acid permease [Klugiella sp. YN-L-19]MDI2098369.1 amino acid permease [Klugiella sp. YN-L-19]
MAAAPTAMKREFTMFSALSVAFAFVSPIVALYSVLGVGLSASGPAFIWGGLVLYAGQFVVVLTLGVLASKWAESGGIYQWSRRLLGHRYGWFASWTYICTLLITLPAVAYAGAVLIPPIFDIPAADPGFVTWLAVGLLALTTVVNLAGRVFIKILMVGVLVAEAVGSVGVAIWLLFFERHQTLDYISPASLGEFDGVFFAAPFVMAIAFSSYFAIGFESASSIAEEVKRPKRAVPRAMVVSFFAIMSIVLLSTLAFTLAVPSDEFLQNPENAADPAVAIMAATFPEPVFRGVLALFVIAFAASLMTIQITVSRIVWATARNGELPFARTLTRLSGDTGLPRVAVLVTAVVAVLLFIPFQSEGIQMALISFSSVGFFISFLFPILGMAIARVRGSWHDEPDLFLGRAGRAVSVLALIWLLFQIVNVAWPRESGAGWATDWSTVIGVGVVGVLGVAVEWWVHRKRLHAAATGSTLVVIERSEDADDEELVEPLAR